MAEGYEDRETGCSAREAADSHDSLATSIGDACEGPAVYEQLVLFDDSAAATARIGAGWLVGSLQDSGEPDRTTNKDGAPIGDPSVSGKGQVEGQIAGDSSQHQLAPARLPHRIRSRQILSKLERQRFVCAYTGDALSPENTSGDHIVPVARGGDHSIDNIALVTKAVNVAKATMTLEEFVTMCRKVVARFGTDGEIKLPR